MTPEGKRGGPGLIVTADDFGRDLAINEAVERAHREGILTTASLMVAGDAAADAVARARRLPGLRVGLHVAVIDARPALPPEEVPALVGADGMFRRNPAAAGALYFFRPDARRQLAREIRAQFAAFAATGLALDHANAHKHMHLHPTVARLIVEIGRPFGLRALRLPDEPRGPLVWAEPGAARAAAPLLGPWVGLLRRRVRRAGLVTTDRVFGIAWSGGFTEERLLALLRHLPDGISEVYLHPAVPLGPDAGPTTPGHASTDEFAALVSPRVRRLIAEAGIRLTSFADLAGGSDPAGEPGAPVVLDTNVFVAAGFNPESSSAAIVRAVEQGQLRLVWNEDTRRETEAVLRRIPRLSWERFVPLFKAEAEYTGAVEPERFAVVEDPEDRKFAALSAASGAVLITNDGHLLAHQGRDGLQVLKPSEFVGHGKGARVGVRPEPAAGDPAARPRRRSPTPRPGG